MLVGHQPKDFLLAVSGPCVDVPADQRDDWEGKPDPSPTLL